MSWGCCGPTKNSTFIRKAAAPTQVNEQRLGERQRWSQFELVASSQTEVGNTRGTRTNSILAASSPTPALVVWQDCYMIGDKCLFFFLSPGLGSDWLYHVVRNQCLPITPGETEAGKKLRANFLQSQTSEYKEVAFSHLLCVGL